MKSINIMALDANFNMVTPLRYTNLQWSRKYHECGTFSMQIPLEQYDSSFRYVYTKDRSEMGKIVQVNYVSKSGYQYIQLSGFFMENELNRMVVYAKGVSNITNDPGWVERIGPAEDVAFEFFNAFRTIQFGGATYRVNVSPGVSRGRGVRAHHTRDNSYLGNKVYHILKSSGMSYRVSYNFEDNSKTFDVWSGLDRSEEQTTNNPVVFSTRYGNIKNPDVLEDNSTYKSGCIVVNKSDSDSNSVTYVRAIVDPDMVDHNDAFLLFSSSANPNDFATTDEFLISLEAEGRSERDSKWVRTLNVEFDAMSGSYEYMQDFDLGDVCSVEIEEIGLSANARLIGCYEVVKKGVWTMTMEFGTPIIKR